VFTITLQPSGWRFEAPAELTIRDAASLADIVLPTSCRNGACRTCISRLQSGTIRYEIEWPGLSAEEKRDGYILPCVALPTSDLVVHAPAASRISSAQD
jgi:ferredoxin